MSAAPSGLGVVVPPLQLSPQPSTSKDGKCRHLSSGSESPGGGSVGSVDSARRGRKSPHELTLNKVHEELEKLNIATDVINKLELQLDEARTAFAEIRSSWTQQLEKLAKKLGNCIDKSRPYYQAKLQARQIQDEAQKAALRFERANSMHAVAKQQVGLTQESLDRQDPKIVNPACLEVLNHHIQRVNEAERERIQSEDEHRNISRHVEEANRKVQGLEKDLGRQIKKSKVYFDRRVEFTRVLEEQKALIERIEMEVKQKKRDYTTSLRNLEKISDAIHAERLLGERGSGVGSETPDPPLSPPMEIDQRVTEKQPTLDHSPPKHPSTLRVRVSESDEGNPLGISPLSPRAKKGLKKLKNSPQSPKIKDLITTLAPDAGKSVAKTVDGEETVVRGRRAMSQPPESTLIMFREIEAAAQQAAAAEAQARQENNGPDKKKEGSRRPASFGGHTGVILLAQQLSEYNWFGNDERKIRAFSFPPEELDMSYKTVPEGVKPLPTPPHTPTEPAKGENKLKALSSGSKTATSSEFKTPLSPILSVSPPATPSSVNLSSSKGHNRNPSNQSVNTLDTCSLGGDSVSLGECSSLGSFQGMDDEVKLNRMLRSHTSLIREIDAVADRAKYESSQLETVSVSSPEADNGGFPTYDRSSASGESSNS